MWCQHCDCAGFGTFAISNDENCNIIECAVMDRPWPKIVSDETRDNALIKRGQGRGTTGTHVVMAQLWQKSDHRARRETRAGVSSCREVARFRQALQGCTEEQTRL